jgi:hypothetical protein
MRQTRRGHWVLVGVAFLGGVLTTWVWMTALQYDLLHRWSRIPPPPSADARLVTIWETTVYLQTPDGHVFAIDPDREHHWHAVDAILPTDDTSSQRVSIGPCDRTDARFRWTAAPPPDIQQCLEAVSRISVGVFTLSVLQDSHQQWWYFQTGGGDFIGLGDMFGVFVVGLAGSIVTYAILRAISG